MPWIDGYVTWATAEVSDNVKCCRYFRYKINYLCFVSLSVNKVRELPNNIIDILPFIHFITGRLQNFVLRTLAQRIQAKNQLRRRNLNTTKYSRITMNIILMLPTRVEEGDKQEITTTTTG